MSNIIELKTKNYSKKFNKNPYTMLFRDSIKAAKKSEASDIHFDPEPDGLLIRFRIHGELVPYKKIILIHSRNFTNEIKEFCNFAIDVSGQPQDSRFSIEHMNLDLRGSLLPTLHGEKIVLRLLERDKDLSLSNLGFDENISIELYNVLKQKNGVVLISGPTGSGKTTTLYNLLTMLNDSSRNIVTIEDPIEYTFKGINQVQVNENITFPKALRSILRQDPDVILVGEIRDFETADLCFKAASTGHLVLSSIHANSAAGVIERLVNLGIDPFTIQSNLRFSFAQRLVKQICERCSQKIPTLYLEEFKELFRYYGVENIEPNECKIKYHCPECSKGVVGRLPILEYMSQNSISKYISSGMKDKPELDITLRESFTKLARLGKVDINEIFNISPL